MSEPSTSGGGRVPNVRQKSISPGTFFFAIVVAVIIAFIAGTRSDQMLASIAPLFGAKISTDSLDLSSVEETYRYLDGNYDGPLDKQALIDGASRGLVEAAGDRYTVFMDKKEAEEFEREMSGEISGVGAEIGVRSGEPKILRVIPEAPAEKAGVLANDQIVGINEESAEGMTAEDAAKKIRGPEGTSVKLTLKRGEDFKEISITRAKVSDKSVRWSVENGIGILKLSRFDDQTAELSRTAADEFKRQGVKGVILDLRDNGGGYLDAARDVASIWLDRQVIVTEKEGDKVIDQIKGTGSPVLNDVKTVVLVNGGSASSSEIVAGALQDYNKAALIGEKTFGKGTVQKIVPLSDGRQLKVTIARWYTPNGKNISKEGIAPDTTVQLTAADTDAGRDPQQQAAIEAVRE